MRATILRLEPETHKALRIAAIEADMSMNDAINQAVETWLKEHRRKGVKKRAATIKGGLLTRMPSRLPLRPATYASSMKSVRRLMSALRELNRRITRRSRCKQISKTRMARGELHSKGKRELSASEAKGQFIQEVPNGGLNPTSQGTQNLNANQVDPRKRAMHGSY